MHHNKKPHNDSPLSSSLFSLNPQHFGKELNVPMARLTCWWVWGRNELPAPTIPLLFNPEPSSDMNVDTGYCKILNYIQAFKNSVYNICT